MRGNGPELRSGEGYSPRTYKSQTADDTTWFLTIITALILILVVK